MRRYLILAAIALQVAVLAGMAGQREYILASGTTVYLPTAPIDPRDPFRGDFVRLHYGLSDVDPTQLASLPERLAKGTIIYAQLQPNARNVAEVQGFSLEEPDSGLFLRGRSRYLWNRNYSTTIAVAYGIETYFVQQGEGLELERRRGTRTGIQIPLEMELAVGGNGTAIIKGHRWSPLGIQLQVLTQENDDDENDDDTPPPAPTLRLSLLNTTDSPLAVVDLPNHCAWSLAAASRWSQTAWSLANDPCEDLSAEAAQLVVLAPNEVHSVVMDFTTPRWYITSGMGENVAISSLPNERFRLVYRPPEADVLPQPDDGSTLWQGELPTPAFRATGQVD